jgi:hypothetical protein
MNINMMLHPKICHKVQHRQVLGFTAGYEMGEFRHVESVLEEQ